MYYPISQHIASTYEYLSIDECIRCNGDRHLINAFNHSQMGNTAFAIGSLKKAIKNYERAEMFKPVKFTGHFLIEQMIDKMSAKIADNIIYGSNYKMYLEDDEMKIEIVECIK